MNRKHSQVKKIEEQLPLHPTTAALSLALADKEISGQLTNALDYHKEHWLGKEHEKTIRDGNSSVSILTTRGAVVTNLQLGGKNIFYHNAEKTQDLQSSLRGSYWMVDHAGPTPKEMPDSPQHGYGRIAEWKPTLDNGFRLDRNELISQEIPGMDINPGIEMTQHVDIHGNMATFMLDVENISNEEAAFAPGFHAYYAVPIDQKNDILLHNLELDKALLQSYLINAQTPDGKSVLKVKNPGKPILLSRPDIGTIKITIPKEFSSLRIRTEKDKPFVCVEPVARGESDEELPVLAAGEKKKYWFTISYLGKSL